MRSRRMAQPAFRRHHLDRFCALFAGATDEVLQGWERAAELGRPLDVEAEMVRVSLANLGASLFQADWRRDMERIAPAVTEILAFANSRLTSVVDTSRLPLPSTRRSTAACTCRSICCCGGRWPTTRWAATASPPAPTSPCART